MDVRRTLLVVAAFGSSWALAGAQGTWRVSIDSSGGQGNGWSYEAAISADGRFVAFASKSSNLVPGDTNGVDDAFVHDRQTGTTTCVSVSSAGGRGDDSSSGTSISADGRFVAFHSDATNLVAGDTNFVADVFVHDRQTGTPTRVSVDSSGRQGDRHSLLPTISGDGRFVAFYSDSLNLVPGDTNGVMDVFVHDRQTGTTTRVSVDSSGSQGDFDSGNTNTNASISADGRFVAFDSYATNLVSGDTNGRGDVFVHDRQTGATTRASIASWGFQVNDHSSEPSISADGRFVAFASRASNLVPDDHNYVPDVFVHDRQSWTTTRVSVDSSGSQGKYSSLAPSISADGRFVAFYSYANNLVPGDTNSVSDVFVHDRQIGTTARVSVDSSGSQGDESSFFPSISPDGRFVAFEGSNLVPGDTNGWLDVFVHGPYLTLEVIPETVAPGGSLVFTTWKGLVGGSALLYVVDLNGTPMFLRIWFGSFDALGLFTASAAVPPGLSGSVLTFMVFGYAPNGKVDFTNREVVTFQ